MHTLHDVDVMLLPKGRKSSLVDILCKKSWIFPAIYEVKLPKRAIAIS
tara:strand:- start:16 stop:159 length:144 start_codon:yes stop_codon:yes gene_type:complete